MLTGLEYLFGVFTIFCYFSFCTKNLSTFVDRWPEGEDRLIRVGVNAADRQRLALMGEVAVMKAPHNNDPSVTEDIFAAATMRGGTKLFFEHSLELFKFFFAECKRPSSFARIPREW